MLSYGLYVPDQHIIELDGSQTSYEIKGLGQSPRLAAAALGFG